MKFQPKIRLRKLLSHVYIDNSVPVNADAKIWKVFPINFRLAVLPSKYSRENPGFFPLFKVHKVLCKLLDKKTNFLDLDLLLVNFIHSWCHLLSSSYCILTNLYLDPFSLLRLPKPCLSPTAADNPFLITPSATANEQR